MPLNLLGALTRLAASRGLRAPAEILSERAVKGLPWWLRNEK